MADMIVLIGGGGHCRSVIEVIEAEGRFSVAGIIDAPGKQGTQVCGYPVQWRDDDIPKLAQEFGNFLITVGQIKSPETRMRLYSAVKNAGGKLPVIVSPTAVVSSRSQIGEGTVVMHQAVVNVGVKVGVNCILNTKSLLEHDVALGDHCHISTGAIANGGAIIGDCTFIGSGAVLRESVRIGENVVIGCCTTIIRDLPQGEVFAE